MLKEEQIKKFIENDRNSDKKKLARVGERYYEGDHDIKKYRIFYFDKDGVIQEDTTRSNTRISHPFFTELIDQKVQYLFSGDGYFIKSDIPELQNILDEYFNENDDFKAELQETSNDASDKGWGYTYIFRDKEGKLSFQSADTMGVVEVRAKDTQDNCDYIIYWYVDRITEKGETIKKVQVWNDKEVYFFTQKNDGKLDKDDSEKINPRTHSVYSIEGQEGKKGESFGFIPFFRLDNNKKQFSDLKPIKDLIDDYDLMACGLSNNLQDLSEGYFVVKGFDGDDISKLTQTLKTKKAIGVGEGGDVDIKTINIPYQARQAKLDIDEKNIYKFGMGFNSSQLGDGNITNIVIKSRYALLDLKCKKFEVNLRKFLKKLVQIVLDEENKKNNKAYSLKDVYFNFEREIMTNASDNAAIAKTEAETRQIEINTLLDLAAVLNNETIIQSICEVLDIDYEDIKDKLPVNEEEETTKAENNLANVPVEEDIEEPVVEV